MVFKCLKTLLHQEKIQIGKLEISLKCSNRYLTYILEKIISSVPKDLNKLPGENTDFSTLEILKNWQDKNL